jgi:hypothetical protein
MPNRSSVWVGKGSKSAKSRGGLSAALSIIGLCVAFAVTGCGNTGTPTAADQQVTTQSTPTPSDLALDSPSAAVVTTAPATSAAPTSAPAKPPAAPAPSTHAAAPAPARTTAAAVTKPSLCGAPSNPFGYNFCGRGGYINSPAGTVCSYFDCIANFYNGRGYMVECNDGTYSMSGGIRGACSYHGGVRRPVYSG